ncbi:unnamed protein product [Schistosoma haematobium]|nr:unnamed protein product [Schistosoma haematobium]
MISTMHQFNYTNHIILKNILLSLLYLSISILNLLDTYYVISTNSIHIINNHEINNEQQLINKININENQLIHKQFLIINHFKYEHTLITYCTEIFGGILNFISASLYFTTQLHSLLLTHNTTTTTTNNNNNNNSNNNDNNLKKKTLKSRFFNIPFPYHYLYPNEQIIMIHKYFEFSSLLIIISSIFSCIMMMITISLRSYKIFMMTNYTENNYYILINSNSTQWFIDITMQKIQQMNQLFLLFLLFIINIHILCLSSGLNCCHHKNNLNNNNNNQSKQNHSIVNIKKDLNFCKQLNQLILLFSSILIIFGSLIIISNIIKCIQINNWFINNYLIEKLKLNNFFNLFNGTLNILIGLLIIMTIKFYLIPLESIIKNQYKNIKIKNFFNCPINIIIIIICCFISISIQINISIMNKLDYLIININQTDQYLLRNSLQLYYYNYAINYFFNFFTLPIISLLLCCIIIDLYLRHKLQLNLKIDLFKQLYSDYNLNNNNDQLLKQKKLKYNYNHQLNNDMNLSTVSYSHLPLHNSLLYNENNTINIRKNRNEGIHQRYSELCPQSNEMKFIKYSPLKRLDNIITTNTITTTTINNNNNNGNDMNEIRSIPYLTSNIHSSNSMNPIYFELDTIQNEMKSSNELDIHSNYLSQIVYKCSMNPSQLNDHKYNEVNQFIYHYPIESCEYMSCDLTQQPQQQQRTDITLIHPEMNNGINNLTSSELIKLFTDTTGEDFITSV